MSNNSSKSQPINLNVNAASLIFKKHAERKKPCIFCIGIVPLLNN